MTLRQIIIDVIRAELKPLIRETMKEILVEELGSQPECPTKLPARSIKLMKPQRRRSTNVQVGQRWKARDYTTIKGRTIEILAFRGKKIIPKLICQRDGATRKSQVKPISLLFLKKNYAKVI
jgi:hypothetical protein